MIHEIAVRLQLRTNFKIYRKDAKDQGETLLSDPLRDQPSGFLWTGVQVLYGIYPVDKSKKPIPSVTVLTVLKFIYPINFWGYDFILQAKGKTAEAVMGEVEGIRFFDRINPIENLNNTCQRSSKVKP